MVRFIFVFTLFTGLTSNAQEITQGERAGLLQVSGSIYPTISLNVKSNMNLIGGHAAYQITDDYSFRGDLLTLTSTQSNSTIYNDYFLLEAGFLRNFSNKRFDYFVGLELGLCRIQLERDLKAFPQYSIQNPTYYQPVWDLTTGFKFHVSQYFYFYGEMKLLNNRNPEANNLQTNLAVTGGLGLQLPTKRFVNSN